MENNGLKVPRLCSFSRLPGRFEHFRLLPVPHFFRFLFRSSPFAPLISTFSPRPGVCLVSLADARFFLLFRFFFSSSFAIPSSSRLAFSAISLSLLPLFPRLTNPLSSLHSVAAPRDPALCLPSRLSLAAPALPFAQRRVSLGPSDALTDRSFRLAWSSARCNQVYHRRYTLSAPFKSGRRG